MLKTAKYRLYPTQAQKQQLEQHFGTCRLVWNLALEVKQRAWKSANINLTRYDLQKQLVDLKREFPWLYEVNSQSLLSVLLNLDNAYNQFFNGGGFPKFKSKRGAQSFRCPGNFRRIEWGKKKIDIPKIRGIKFRGSVFFIGEIRTITIIRTVTGKYFACVLIDDKVSAPAPKAIETDSSIGIDVGIKSFALISDGRSFQPNRFLKNSLKRLQCLQGRASHKKKGGQNRKKCNLKVALLHERITNQRTDYIHKITTNLIRDKQTETFVVEDLNLFGMTQNRRLARSISDASFGEFFRQMKYKCGWYGKNLIVIDRFAPSSKRCSDCGKINDELTLADREWRCSCGAHHDRDLNAAKNIKFFGLNTPVGSRGEPVESRRKRRAEKQEKVLVNTFLPQQKEDGILKQNTQP